MQYAIDKNKDKIEATPNSVAICPGCNSEVIAKCGSIKIWHWAHKKDDDCDPWYEPESIWHRDWKEMFEPMEREVVIGSHRADVKHNGIVIELQNSPISVDDIQAREKHYGRMIWIINGKDFFNDRFITYEQGTNLDNEWSKFRWKHPRECWMYAAKPVFIDIGDLMFRIKKFYSGGRGWGNFIYKHELLKILDSGFIYIPK